jgi:alanine dehydrogenase
MQVNQAKPKGTLLLTRSDVERVLTLEDCIDAVEKAFELHGEGKTSPPGILGVHATEGGFHIKAALLQLEKSYFAAKVNANFSQNAKRFGLPLIQGVIVLCDGENGSPLALMDSIEITIQRTGAATAVAAKYLARSNSRVLTICGCGNQGRVSLKGLSRLFALDRVFAYDIDTHTAEKFCGDMLQETGLTVLPAANLAEAVRLSDLVVTCTPATESFLKKDFLKPGTFVAAVGADSETKQELDPTLLKNKVVVDILEQCATIGELHHAIDCGLTNRNNVHAELGEVVARRKPARESDEEIIVFDSTGMALQDVIVAAAVYEKAINDGLGTFIDFAGNHQVNLEITRSAL